MVKADISERYSKSTRERASDVRNSTPGMTSIPLERHGYGASYGRKSQSGYTGYMDIRGDTSCTTTSLLVSQDDKA